MGTIWSGAGLFGLAVNAVEIQKPEGSANMCWGFIILRLDVFWGTSGLASKATPRASGCFIERGKEPQRREVTRWWAAEPAFQPKSLGPGDTTLLTTVQHRVSFRGSRIQLSSHLSSSLPGLLISGLGSEIFSSPCDLLQAKGTGRLRVALGNLRIQSSGLATPLFKAPHKTKRRAMFIRDRDETAFIGEWISAPQRVWKVCSGSERYSMVWKPRGKENTAT